MGRTAPLLKPPQSPHCKARETRSYRAYQATQTPLFSKNFDVTIW